MMASHRFGKFEVIAVLLEHAAGTSTRELCRKYEISQRTLYRWKAEWRQQEEVPDPGKWQDLVEENRYLKSLLATAILRSRAPNGPGQKK